MKDRLSALLDGDLEDLAARPVLDGLQRDEALRRDWATYCLIGDTLRGEPVNSPDFVGRVMAELDQEPTRLTPPRHVGSAAANQSPWRSLMPLAASVMGVAAVGLVAASLYSGQEQQVARLAKVVGSAPSVVAPAAVARSASPQLTPPAPAGDGLNREYVFAHQALGGGGPVPTAIQYVRSVSDVGEGASR